MGMKFWGNKCAEVKCQQGDTRVNFILGIHSCGIASLTIYLWPSGGPSLIPGDIRIYVSLSIFLKDQ